MNMERDRGLEEANRIAMSTIDWSKWPSGIRAKAPEEEKAEDLLNTVSKAWPYLAEHASHFDGTFNLACQDLRGLVNNLIKHKVATTPSQPGSAICISPNGKRSEYFAVEEAYWRKTEYNCATMKLDELGVPKEDSAGNVYSIVGRINLLWERAAKAESSLETIELRRCTKADE